VLAAKPELQSTIDLAGHGTGRLPTDVFKSIRIRLPELSEQRKIAHILGTLDDKIELNRRMNETLEAMAQAIFKSWFVDFDPVRAKMSGKPPENICQRLGLTPELLDLFPEHFQDSEIGEIPEGWRLSQIDELANVVGGSTPSTKNTAFWDDGHHFWATPKDLSNLAEPVLLETERKITDAGLDKIGSGLLPKGTVLLSSRAPIGYRAIAEVPVAINQGFIALLPNDGVSNLFLLFWVEWAHDEIVSRANGSTFLEISKASFKPIPVISPPPNIFLAFDQLVKPLYSQIVCKKREIDSLANTRDILLPKLLSGEFIAPVAGDV
jgi:type I restriction enzyme S subunit